MSGLARLLTAEKVDMERRRLNLKPEEDEPSPWSSTLNISTASSKGPVTMGEAHWGWKSNDVLPGSTQQTWRGNGHVTGDELYNINEAANLRPALYSAGVVPFRIGWDARRIEAMLNTTRENNDYMVESGEGMSGRGTSTLTAQRSTLPSENALGWGYDIFKLLPTSAFSRAETCASFFPVQAAGFNEGVHVEGSGRESLSELVFKVKMTKGEKMKLKQVLGLGLELGLGLGLRLSG